MPVRKASVQRRRGVASILVATATAVGLAGCGSKDEQIASTPTATTPAPPPAPIQTLQISADPAGALRFRPAKLTAKAGEVAILMTNPTSSGTSHGVGIIGTDIDVRGITVVPGRLSEAAADLQPGSYVYFCTVSSHRKAGMRGRLEVR
jgi:plastocyanin